MEDIEKQEVPNYREELKNRMKTRYPDHDFDTEEGENGTDSTTRLEQSIIDALNEDEKRTKDYGEMETEVNKLKNIFAKTPRSNTFLDVLAKTGDPSKAIYSAYGKDAFDAFLDGDASEFIAKVEAEDAKMRSDNEEFEKEKEANLSASFAALDEWGNKKGLDEDAKVQTFMRFYEILSDALVGKYSEDLFEMGWKADHYDEDVANARHEGEVDGRNANIKEKYRKRSEVDNMPPSLMGQGVREDEVKKKKDDPWMLDGRY